MPVLIAAYSTEIDVVRAVATRLAADGGEIRCYLEEDDYDLRSIGCKVAVGSMDDPDTLEGALTSVHTFVPLLPDPFAIGEKQITKVGDFAAVGAESARGVAQTILTLPPLSDGDGDLGRVYQAAGKVFADAVKPLCILITGFLWGPERPMPRVVAGLGESVNDSTVSILRLGELASLIASADDREDLDGRWEFGGRTAKLSDLRESSEVAQPLGSPRWAAGIFARGRTVGRSAVDELGLTAGQI